MSWRPIQSSLNVHVTYCSVLDGARSRYSDLSCKRVWNKSSLCRTFASQSSFKQRIRRHSDLRRWNEIQTQPVTVAGLVRSIRKQKKVSFAHISDGTTLEPVQAILDPVLAKDISIGSYVELSGNWERSLGKGQAFELQVDRVEKIGVTVPDDFPIQKKSLTPDFLRSIPHLRLRAPFYSLLARTRSQLITSVHNFYSNIRQAGPATQVHPPLITSSDCEGAGEVFVVSPKKSKSLSNSNDAEEQAYFKSPKYLTVSSQLHLEAYSAELGDVWALSPTFRAEKSDTPRHLSEFYMLEAEFRAVTTVRQIMDEAEQLLKYVVQSLVDCQCGEELASYNSESKLVSSEGPSSVAIEKRWSQITTTSWPTISYSKAIQHLQNYFLTHPGCFEHAPSFEAGLALEHEKHLVTNIANDVPLFITEYPRHLKPFYMLPSKELIEPLTESTTDTAACFDLLFPYGTAELAGGSLREHRLENLIASMRQKGLIRTAGSSEPFGLFDPSSQGTFTDTSEVDYPFLRRNESLGSLQWYADLRRFGSQPHGGFGIGFDRLLAYVTGINSVRDTVGFPRYFGRADC